jgi:hypothetical protein
MVPARDITPARGMILYNITGDNNEKSGNGKIGCDHNTPTFHPLYENKA